MIKADPNKFYHVFTSGLFPYYNWETGDWDKFEIKPEYVKSVSDCYNATIHKAPVWIGHPYGGAEALAWVAASKYEDGMLYNSFDWIDEELINAINNKRYQYVSVEFGRVMNVENDYQVALGITNLPRVSGQKPLEVTDGYEKKKGSMICAPITNSFSIDLVKDFSDINKKHFFQNQNNNSMNEFLRKLATLFGIDVNLYNSDEAAFNKISETYSSLTGDKTKLETQNKELVDQRVKFALDTAIESGRLIPEERDSYESLLRGNFEAANKVLQKLPVHPAFSQTSIAAGGKGTDVADPSKPPAEDKFSNPDGSKMNYEQFLKKVAEDPSFAAKFTNDEIYSMPGAGKLSMKG